MIPRIAMVRIPAIMRLVILGEIIIIDENDISTLG
jgi:hypothetical protein